MKKISKKQQQINKLEQELAKSTLQKRKDDTRRKILIGAMIIGKTKNDPEFNKRVLAELDRFLEREADRKLFNLD
ncbi:hypothetical protein NIES4102_43950 (plasmid) [Chondrocystis sp. NIES-4102]|nr:hypothetical protein NIES4102_43950 [Chondrocystis sp. NIES-4102]